MMVPSLAAKEIPEGAAGPDGLCADGLVTTVWLVMVFSATMLVMVEVDLSLDLVGLGSLEVFPPRPLHCSSSDTSSSSNPTNRNVPSRPERGER